MEDFLIELNSHKSKGTENLNNLLNNLEKMRRGKEEDRWKEEQGEEENGMKKEREKKRLNFVPDSLRIYMLFN